MENDRLIEKVNTALNILESVRAELLKGDKGGKKAKKNTASDPLKDTEKGLNEMGDLNQQITIKRTLEKYGQPTDDDHIASVQKIINSNGLTLEQLDSCLERVKYANDKEPKNNIKAYTYSCLYKVAKS